MSLYNSDTLCRMHCRLEFAFSAVQALFYTMTYTIVPTLEVYSVINLGNFHLRTEITVWPRTLRIYFRDIHDQHP